MVDQTSNEKLSSKESKKPNKRQLKKKEKNKEKAVPEKVHRANPKVDKYKVISVRLNDELSEIDKQIVIVQQQLDGLNQQRNGKL